MDEAGTRSIYSTDPSTAPAVGELTPYVQARYIFDKILSLSGFEFNDVDSATLTEQLDKMYIPFTGESGYIQTLGNAETAQFRMTAGINGMTVDKTDFVLTTINGLNYRVCEIPLMTVDYDYGSNLTGNVYTVPFNGRYQIYGNINIEIDAPLNNANLHVGVITTSGGVDYLQGYHSQFQFFDVITQTWILNTDIQRNAATSWTSDYAADNYLNAGTDVRLVLYSVGSTAIDSFNGNITFIDVGPSQQNIFLTKYITKPLSGNAIDWAANAPIMKCSEFISSLFKMFNLVVIADDVNPKLLTFMPIQEYLEQGNVKDWSNKIDISKDITLTSTADYQSKENLWTYKAMNDYYNQLYNAQGGRVYGRLLLIDPENDFATKEQKTEIMFGATPLNNIKGSDYPIPKFQSANGQFAAPGARILYKTNDTFEFYLFQDQTNGSVLTQFNLFSHYTTTIPTIADEDLNFGQEIPLHYVDSTPYKTLYQRYWNDYISDIYAPDARVIEAFFALDFADIYQFKFNDKIFIKDAYYRILEISDYVVGMQDSVKIKLLKMVSATPDCLLSPKPVIGINGNIIWEDSEGTTQPATETCCNNYGYYWVGSECYATPRDSKGRGGKTQMTSDVTTDISNVETTPVNKSAYIAPNNIVIEPNERLFVNGDGNYVGAGNDGSIITGSRNIVTSGIGSVTVLGSSSKVLNDGVTLGSGGTYAGQYQSGIIQVRGSGDWTNATTPITLTTDRNSYITVPSESLWYIKIMIVAAHGDAITGIDVNITSEFNVHLAESGGLSIKNITQVDSNVHSTTGDIELDLDLVGSTFAPMVYLKNSSYPLTDINIAAQIIYTQYHYE